MRVMRQPEPDATGLAGLQASFLCEVKGGPSRKAGAPLLPFEKPPGDTVDARLAIYSSGYVARLVEALENDYPATRRILGAAAFASLGARYLRACPPRSYDIGRAGDRVALFLVQDPLTRDLPFLPDLARLEWALAEAFIAADAKPTTWADLAALDADAVAKVTFRLRPGTTIVPTRWPIVAIRSIRDMADRDVSVFMEERPQPVLVYREGLEVRYRVIGEGDADFFQAASRGLRLVDLAGDDSSENDVEALVARFRAWVSEGLFVHPDVSTAVHTGMAS